MAPKASGRRSTGTETHQRSGARLRAGATLLYARGIDFANAPGDVQMVRRRKVSRIDTHGRPPPCEYPIKAMILDAACHISFSATAPIPAIMMLRPRSGYAQWITREEYVFAPHAPVVEFTDSFGNLCQRVLIPRGQFDVHCSCRAHTADTIDVDPGAAFVPVHDLPEGALQFLLPSRYCQSDMLNEMAGGIVGQRPAGYGQVAAIEQWLRDEMKYVHGTSDAHTSAVDTAKSKSGVCRDYAHLGIALTRSLNIPARMVVGYMYDLEPMDLPAWFEAFVGGRWLTFDGVRKQCCGNRIIIGCGRDAADVALTSNYGALQLNTMKVTVVQARPGANAPGP